jgi:hypothetical protein
MKCNALNYKNYCGLQSMDRDNYVPGFCAATKVFLCQLADITWRAGYRKPKNLCWLPSFLSFAAIAMIFFSIRLTHMIMRTPITAQEKCKISFANYFTAAFVSLVSSGTWKTTSTA